MEEIKQRFLSSALVWNRCAEIPGEPLEIRGCKSREVLFRMVANALDLFSSDELPSALAWAINCWLAHPATDKEIDIDEVILSKGDRALLVMMRQKYPVYFKALGRGRIDRVVIPHPHWFRGHSELLRVGPEKFLESETGNPNISEVFTLHLGRGSLFRQAQEALFCGGYDSYLHKELFELLVPKPLLFGEEVCGTEIRVIPVVEAPRLPIFTYESCPTFAEGCPIGTPDQLKTGVIVEIFSVRYRVQFDYYEYIDENGWATGVPPEKLRISLTRTEEPLTPAHKGETYNELVMFGIGRDSNGYGPIPVMGRMPYCLMTFHARSELRWCVMVDVLDGELQSAWISWSR